MFLRMFSHVQRRGEMLHLALRSSVLPGRTDRLRPSANISPPPMGVMRRNRFYLLVCLDAQYNSKCCYVNVLASESCLKRVIKI